MRKVRRRREGRLKDDERSTESRVGIFWLLDGRFILDGSSLDHADPYGACMTHAVGHLEHWGSLQKARKEWSTKRRPAGEL